MPFKSKAQQRKFFAMANRGEISKKKAKEWADETPNIKDLPERKKSKKHAEDDSSMVDKAAMREVANMLHGMAQKPSVMKPKKAKKPKARLNKGRAPKGSTLQKSSADNLVNSFIQEILKLSQVKVSAPLPVPPPWKDEAKTTTTGKEVPFIKEKDRKKKDIEIASKSAELLTRAFIHKLAELSQQEIANALANKANEREISPEEVDAFAQQQGSEQGKSTGLLSAILGGLAGAAGGGAIGSHFKHPVLGALGGLLAGGGISGGLGYLAGRRSGVNWGRHLGELAQAGELPSPLGYAANDYVPYAIGKHEDQVAPLSPEEFEALRSQMAQEAMIQGGLAGIGSGGMSSIYNSADGEGTFASAMRPIAYGATEAAQARAEAVAQAQKIQDLYRRGYVDLGDRVREESGY